MRSRGLRQHQRPRNNSIFVQVAPVERALGLVHSGFSLYLHKNRYEDSLGIPDRNGVVFQSIWQRHGPVG